MIILFLLFLAVPCWLLYDWIADKDKELNFLKEVTKERRPRQ